MNLTIRRKHDWGWSEAQMSATNHIGSDELMPADGLIAVLVELVPEEAEYMVDGALRKVPEAIKRGDEIVCAWLPDAKPGATGRIRVVTMRRTLVEVKVRLGEPKQ